MRSRLIASLALFTSAAVLMAPACGPDPKPLDCPEPHPAFDVLVVAPDGPLPPDLKLSVRYGGSSEEIYRLGVPGERQVVFCRASGTDGGVLSTPEDAGSDADASLEGRGEGGGGGNHAELEGGAAGQSAGAAGRGSDGHGGQGGQSEGGSSGILSSDEGWPGLRCELYTEGPATIELEATGFEPEIRELRLSPKVCTVFEAIELSRLDAGL